MTINTKMLDKFKEHLNEREKSEATIKKYMHDIKYFAAFVGNGVLCKQTVLDYKQKLGANYAPSSANSMIAATNLFLRYCGKPDMCVRRFCIQKQAYRSETKQLTRAEYLRLVGAAQNKNDDRLALIIQTVCATGIRIGELKYITVEAVRSGEAAVVCKGKIRRIFIVSKLKKRLKEYIKRRGIHFGPIFVTRRGRPIDRITVWKQMKSLCASAHVADSKVFPHNLRHLFACVFYKNEKDIVKLADILGHSGLETTRIYTLATGAEHRRKIEKMHLVL